MISIRNEKTSDVAAREALLDVAYGPVRFTKPSEALRRDRLAAEGLSLVATEHGRIVGTVRLWHVDAGGVPAVLLGPLAVHPDYRGRRLGAALTDRAVRTARMRGHKAVLLIGDPGYYGRFGFTAEKTGNLAMPGGCDAHRLLAQELVPGALDGASGIIAPAGKPAPRRRLLPSVAVERLAAVSHAA